jgi:antitoxin MazE
MKTQISKWGNSLAIRIPGNYAKELHLEEGMEIEIVRLDGGLFLRLHQREYTLKELLAQIKPENIHGETDWRPSVGDEAWS